MNDHIVRSREMIPNCSTIDACSDGEGTFTTEWSPDCSLFNFERFLGFSSLNAHTVYFKRLYTTITSNYFIDEKKTYHISSKAIMSKSSLLILIHSITSYYHKHSCAHQDHSKKPFDSRNFFDHT